MAADGTNSGGSQRLRYSEIVPIWWLFTLVYGAIIATNISVLVTRLADPKRVPVVSDGEATSSLVLFLLAMAILLADWLWTSTILCDYPTGYPFYQRYLSLSPRTKAALLLIHTAYIVAYGISFSLFAKWEATWVLMLAWDNPILWFSLSMLCANAWDVVAVRSDLLTGSPISYYASMYGLMLLPWWWLFQLPGSSFVTSYQVWFFIVMLALLAFWRVWSLRPPAGSPIRSIDL